MAPSTVRLTQSLRPWFDAGLEFVLCEHADTVTNLRQTTSQACIESGQACSVSEAAAPQTGPSQVRVRSDAVPPEPAPKIQRSAPPKAVSQVRGPETFYQKVPVEHDPEWDSGAYSGQVDYVDTDLPCGQVRWPVAWRDLWLRQTPPASCVLTYRDLGWDLGGKPDPVRRHTLQQLMRALALPKGSMAFWPFTLPLGNTLHSSLKWFHAGIKSLQADTLIIIGSDSYRALFAQKPEPLSLSGFSGTVYTASEGDLSVMILPSIEQLQMCDPSSMQALANQLRPRLLS